MGFCYTGIWKELVGWWFHNFYRLQFLISLIPVMQWTDKGSYIFFIFPLEGRKAAFPELLVLCIFTLRTTTYSFGGFPSTKKNNFEWSLYLCKYKASIIPEPFHACSTYWEAMRKCAEGTQKPSFKKGTICYLIFTSF